MIKKLIGAYCQFIGHLIAAALAVMAFALWRGERPQTDAVIKKLTIAPV